MSQESKRTQASRLPWLDFSKIPSRTTVQPASFQRMLEEWAQDNEQLKNPGQLIQSDEL
jgi:hypothetical protein